jgi:hypothetical protein
MTETNGGTELHLNMCIHGVSFQMPVFWVVAPCSPVKFAYVSEVPSACISRLDYAEQQPRRQESSHLPP